MPFIALTPAVVAAVLSYGSTVSFIAAIVNGVLSFYAINTILNLRGQLESGTTDDSFKTYKSGSVAVLTITWLVAIILIVVAIL